MDWSLLTEALLLVAAAGIVFAAWMQARLRDRRATQALRASEERFRNLTALSADWFWETDADQRITWLTGGPTVLRFFGSGLAFGKRLWELPGVELKGAAFTAHVEKVERRLPFFELELARADADGLRHVHAVSGQPRYDAAGSFLGYRGVGRDITERRRAEVELAAAKERLQLALDSSGGILWDTDLQTGKVYLSEGWAEFLGLPRAPTVTTVEELLRGVHPEDVPGGLKISVEVMKGQRPDYSGEHRFRVADGSWKWLLSRGRVTERDAAGRALRMTGINLDVTARKLAEQARNEAEERYRALIELAPDGVVVSSGGIVEYANPAAMRLLRARSPREVLGRSMESFVHPAHVERYRERPVLVALLSRGQEVLPAIFRPFDRTAEHQRHGRDHRLFRIERRLHAEAAADVRRDHADRFDVAAEQIGQNALPEMRRLRCRPDREHPGQRIVPCRDGAGFHRHAAAAVHPELPLDDVRGSGEGLIRIAVSHCHVAGDVVRQIGMRRRCVRLDGFAAILDDRQGIVVDLNQRRGVLGLVAVLGDHHGDCLADEANFVRRQRVLCAHDLDDGVRHQVRDAVAAHRAGKVGRGQYGTNARHRLGCRRVDGLDLSVREWTADKAGVQHAGQLHIIDEAAAAGEQRPVLEPPYRGPAWLPGGHPQTIWPYLLRRPAVPVRRERVTAPDGDFWDFDCKFGHTAEESTVIHLSEMNKFIDEAEAQQLESFYVEILVKPGYRTKKPTPKESIR